MNTHVFLITAKTNLHVGDESGSTFSVIDKAIQRDPLTKLPCINSSSLKGAIKEFCVNNLDEETSLNIKNLFGSDVDATGKANHNDSQKGSAIFFDAKLLLMPQQNDTDLFYYTTCEKVIEQMNDKIALFDKKEKEAEKKAEKKAEKEAEKDKDKQNKKVEETLKKVKSKIKYEKDITTVTFEKFKESCSDDNLPIIARNVLENGESKNLWYEQVLPAETVFYAIIREKGDDLKNALNGKLVQIGANATIGYGYCMFNILEQQAL